MPDRNRELVPDNWSLLREGALTTGLGSEGWYSEHPGVCRRADSFLPLGRHMTSSPVFSILVKHTVWSLAWTQTFHACLYVGRIIYENERFWVGLYSLWTSRSSQKIAQSVLVPWQKRVK